MQTFASIVATCTFSFVIVVTQFGDFFLQCYRKIQVVKGGVRSRFKRLLSAYFCGPLGAYFCVLLGTFISAAALILQSFEFFRQGSEIAAGAARHVGIFEPDTSL
jgi:hypothetical protein